MNFAHLQFSASVRGFYFLVTVLDKRLLQDILIYFNIHMDIDILNIKRTTVEIYVGFLKNDH